MKIANLIFNFQKLMVTEVYAPASIFLGLINNLIQQVSDNGNDSTKSDSKNSLSWKI